MTATRDGVMDGYMTLLYDGEPVSTLPVKLALAFTGERTRRGKLESRVTIHQPVSITAPKPVTHFEVRSLTGALVMRRKVLLCTCDTLTINPSW